MTKDDNLHGELVLVLKLAHGELHTHAADRLCQHLAILENRLPEYVTWLHRKYSEEIQSMPPVDVEPGWRLSNSPWARALSMSTLNTIAEYLNEESNDTHS